VRIHIPLADQRKSLAGGARATRSANAVNVIFGVIW
jgi:hypothetical protein